jgi:hypothetical protein
MLWHALPMSPPDRPRAAARLPRWPDGTVVILVTGGGDPHAIPVSAALRAGDQRVLLGLARSRDSLARLRRDPRVALSITAGGDIAVTAYGSATVLDEQLTAAVAAVAVAVDRVQDHNRPTFEIDAGVTWRWTDATAARRDEETRAALARLASTI